MSKGPMMIDEWQLQLYHERHVSSAEFKALGAVVDPLIERFGAELERTLGEVVPGVEVVIGQ